MWASRLCTQAQFNDPSYPTWCRQMAIDPVMHRKQWEFVYIAQALHAAGMLSEGRAGIGFGVGREPLPALFAAYGVQVLATDAPYDPQSPWVEGGQYAANVAALPWQGICDRAAFESRIRFTAVDMTAIPNFLRLGQFDFAWSACSLDHLGSLSAGLDFIRVSLECVRPGGLVVHTTEYNLSSQKKTVDTGPVVLYRASDLLAFADECTEQGHKISLDLSQGAGTYDGRPDPPPYGLPHLAVDVNGYTTTSVGLTIQKAGIWPLH